MATDDGEGPRPMRLRDERVRDPLEAVNHRRYAGRSDE
jgi:hypothetical protein